MPGDLVVMGQEDPRCPLRLHAAVSREARLLLGVFLRRRCFLPCSIHCNPLLGMLKWKVYRYTYHGAKQFVGDHRFKLIANIHAWWTSGEVEL